MNEGDKKTVMIIGGIIAMGIVIFAAVMFFENYTTDFDSYFISGSIPGVAEEQDLSQFPILGNISMISYKDSSNYIVYDAYAFKGANFYSKLIKISGFSSLGTKNYNGVDWEVYSTSKIENNSVISNLSSELAKYNIVSCDNGYIFVCSQNNITYLADVSINATNASNTTYDFNSDLYKNYAEPYMNSMELKNANNVTSLADTWNISDEQYNLIVQYINNLDENNSSAYNLFAN